MKNPEGRQRNDDVLIDMFKLFDENQIKQLFHPDVYKKINGLYRTVPEQYCSKNQHPLHTYFMLVFNEHGRRGTMGGNLAIGMFCEMRMLSYDNDVLNFGMSLPLAYREHQYLYRKTFSNLFPALASVKRQGNRLPITASNFQYELKHVENKIAAVALRSSLKHVVKYYKPWISPTYTNHAEWFRGQLKEKVTDLLLHTELKCGELLNKDYVKTLVNEHMEGKRNNASLLWQVINLEYFYRNFID